MFYFEPDNFELTGTRVASNKMTPYGLQRSVHNFLQYLIFRWCQKLLRRVLPSPPITNSDFKGDNKRIGKQVQDGAGEESGAE